MCNKLKRCLLAMSLLLATMSVFAAIDVYEFQNEADRVRFQKLTGELRCPKCQNQNIADSNAPIAQDLRSRIQSMLVEKKTDDEIIDYMIGRYGDFVLYQPRLASKTYILWFGPIALLLLGMLVVVIISKRNALKAGQQTSAPVELDQTQQQQLDALLAQTDSNKTSSGERQ